MANCPKLYNIKTDDVPHDAVYIGRPSKWGNPFVIGQDGNRKEVIKKFAKLVSTDREFREAIQRELAGKDLACFCAPKPCHGDILLKVANVKPQTTV